jgi:hypothetical protein
VEVSTSKTVFLAVFAFQDSTIEATWAGEASCQRTQPGLVSTPHAVPASPSKVASAEPELVEDATAAVMSRAGGVRVTSMYAPAPDSLAETVVSRASLPASSWVSPTVRSLVPFFANEVTAAPTLACVHFFVRSTTKLPIVAPRSGLSPYVRVPSEKEPLATWASMRSVAGVVRLSVTTLSVLRTAEVTVLPARALRSKWR